jgi:hypothetical protein
MVLNRSELMALTGKKYASHQARELEHLGIPFKRRTDGTLVVLRVDVEGKQDVPVLAPTSDEYEEECRRESDHWRRERKRFGVLPLDQLRGLPEARFGTSASGVYFLWRGPRLQYIGKAFSVGSRIKAHALIKDFTRATYMPAHTENIRKFEQEHCLRYLPPLNLTRTG